MVQLVDQIYRTRANIAFCKKHGIRISGPKLGRRSSDEKQNQADKKTAYKDNTDRIGVESPDSRDTALGYHYGKSRKVA